MLIQLHSGRGVLKINNLKKFIAVFSIQLVSGCLAIYIIDKIIAANGYNLYVGINGITAMTVGVLGLPGVAMLFGIAEIIKYCA